MVPDEAGISSLQRVLPPNETGSMRNHDFRYLVDHKNLLTSKQPFVTVNGRLRFTLGAEKATILSGENFKAP